MTTPSNIRPDVLELLWNEFCTTVRYQKKQNDITVTMTFDEYLTLWSQTRIKSIGERIDRGEKSIEYYMGNQHFRPVCSWVSREARVRGGTMTVQNAKIRSAEDSKKLFQFQAGDRHDETAKARIGAAKAGKKQTPEQIAKRTATRVATMAAKRAASRDVKSGPQLLPSLAAPIPFQPSAGMVRHPKMSIIREKTAKIAVLVRDAVPPRFSQPRHMGHSQNVSDDWGRDDECRDRIASNESDVYKTIEQVGRHQPFVLPAHMPSTVTALVVAGLDLDGERLLPAVIGDHDVTVWNARWSQGRDEPSPQ